MSFLASSAFRPRLPKAATRQDHQLALALLKLPTGMEGDRLQAVLEECMRDAKVDADLLAGAVDAAQCARALYRNLGIEVRQEATGADSALRAFYEAVDSERKLWTEQPELWPEQLLRFEVERLLAVIERDAGTVRHFGGTPGRSSSGNWGELRSDSPAQAEPNTIHVLATCFGADGTSMVVVVRG